MDFDIFERQLRKAYTQSHSSFTFDECQKVFKTYFRRYREHFGNDHPPLKTAKLVEIINQIDGGGQFEPGDYPSLIESYFRTYFWSCDRNICHFFSGRIREIRFYEIYMRG